jgi:hypothetical protein
MNPLKEQTSGKGILAAVVLFAFGFLFVAFFLHQAIHSPLYLHADMRSEKLLMLERLKGTVYSAAFGSSHIHNGFDPRVFDNAVAGSPAQTHTINLSVPGGSQSEQRSMALEFLKNLQSPPPNTACFVMLELNAGANFQNVHLVHPRSINVYDWRTVRFISHLTDAQMGLTQRVGRIGFALVATVLHYTNVGMLSNKVFAPPIDQTIMQMETRDDRRGIEVEGLHSSTNPILSKEVDDQTTHFVGQQQEIYPGNYELIDELADVSPVRNVSFAYFVFPKFGDFTAAPIYPDHIVTPEGRSVPILNFDRPDLYPFLFKSNLWHDEAHLDGQGAAIVTRLIANQLKAWYVANGAPRPCGG